MVATIKEHAEELWWLFILQGIASIIFGVVALFYPGLTLLTLVISLAVYAVIIGIIDVIHGLSSVGRTQSSWFSLILGLVLLGMGIYLVRNPAISLGAFIIVVGTILVVRGIFDLVAAAFFGGADNRRWLMAVSGILGVVAGVYIWSNPVVGGLAFIWAIGLYAFITGAITISYALYMKGLFNELKRTIEGSTSGRMAHGHK